MRSQPNNRLSILCLYGRSQTFTQTVFEHLESFASYSGHDWAFLDYELLDHLSVDLNAFDAVVVHYSVRLPYDQISSFGADKLGGYPGLKVLFIQDEYDRTGYTQSLIRRIGFGLVFSVVPSQHLEMIYPAAEFPGVVFVSNLTGYVPEGLAAQTAALPLPSKRSLMVGYRGRPLPLRYGQLGREKVEIGRLVKEYCDVRCIPNDIAWSEEARIYGTHWYEFLASCRAMLGSESGSNVFDWDGSLEARIGDYRRANPLASDAEVYRHVVLPQERPGLMNQISPRLFEAIAARTVLVLFEGTYSGVVKPGEHYIELRKDGSNLDEVFELLRDDDYVDGVAQRAYDDIIRSDTYSYRRFVKWVDELIDSSSQRVVWSGEAQNGGIQSTASRHDGVVVYKMPLRPAVPAKSFKRYLLQMLMPLRPLWRQVPEPIRDRVRPMLGKIF
jgi:hypothetical protein